MGKYTAEEKDAKEVIATRSIKTTRKKKRTQELAGC